MANIMGPRFLSDFFKFEGGLVGYSCLGNCSFRVVAITISEEYLNYFCRNLLVNRVTGYLEMLLLMEEMLYSCLN